MLEELSAPLLADAATSVGAAVRVDSDFGRGAERASCGWPSNLEIANKHVRPKSPCLDGTTRYSITLDSTVKLSSFKQES
jgi:hypothetical protein